MINEVVSAFYKAPKKIERYNDDDSNAASPVFNVGKKTNKSVDFGGTTKGDITVTSDGKKGPQVLLNDMVQQVIDYGNSDFNDIVAEVNRVRDKMKTRIQDKSPDSE